MALLRGTRLGSYEAIAPFGSGEMGEVWRVAAGGGRQGAGARSGGRPTPGSYVFVRARAAVSARPRRGRLGPDLFPQPRFLPTASPFGQSRRTP